MPKSIALFDIDNTMYDGFSYFELLAKQADEGMLKADVLTAAKNCMQQYKAGIQSYEAAIVELIDIYAKGLAGVSYETVLRSTKEFYTQSPNFFAYVQPTIATLRASHDIALVTGEPQFVAAAVAERFAITKYYSSEYEVKGGVFTGTVTKHLASRHEKQAAIAQSMQNEIVKNSIAFGDSEGDIEMLRSVEHAICINPTAGLRHIANHEGWHMPALDEVGILMEQLA